METIQKFVWAAHEVVLAYHDGNLAAAIRELDTAVKEVVSLAREFRPIDDPDAEL